MPALLLVRYGELALKSPPVRREFERMLRHNVVEHFAIAGISCRLRADHGHLYVEADDGPTAVRILRRVFGITSVSEVLEVPTDRTAIRDALLAVAAPRLTEGASFAVRARRTGQHAFTSQQLAADLGGDILEKFVNLHLTVDLERPTCEFHVEVRDARTYLYTDRSSGPGGLPLGVAGRVVALVDGPRGALGAYLLMKRGCRCALLPTPAGAPLVEEVLRRFDPHATVGALAATPEEADQALGTMADDVRVDGIVLPLKVEDYPNARQRWGDRVLFSPTVGLTDEEVLGRWHAAAQLAA